MRSVFIHNWNLINTHCLWFQEPSFIFTEEYQVDFIKEYHKVFDVLKKDFLVGEMIWNFADFMTDQRMYIN